MKKAVIHLESDIENAALAGQAVRGICYYTPLSPFDQSNVELAVVEAVTNIIRHSYGNEPGHKIEVAVAVFEDHILVEIIDRGKTLDRALKKRLDFDPCKVESLPERGMGQFLICKVMDHVSFGRSGKKNRLVMKKYFPESA